MMLIPPGPHDPRTERIIDIMFIAPAAMLVVGIVTATVMALTGCL